MDGSATGAGRPSVGDVSAQLRAAVRRLYSRFRSERGTGELGDAAVAVLRLLRDEGPQTLKALSSSARVTPASMSQTVNRLTASGYAVRTPDRSDGRKVLFEPTAEGLRAGAAGSAASIAWLDAQLAGLSDAERAVLAEAIALLERIADS